jgi:hypothetical protein
VKVVGYISVNWVRTRIGSFMPQHFDVLVTVGSWERRCHSILEWKGLSCDNAIILRFAGTPMDNPEKANSKARNIEILESGIPAHATSWKILDLPKSTAMAQSFHIVGEAIAQLASVKSRRLRICVDVSSMPRSLICFLILSSFKQMITDHVSCFFAISDHGESVELVATEGLAGLATRAPYVEGKWELMTVPYGEGRITGGRNDNIIVSVGLDTYQILDVIERIEPAGAIFLFPKRADGSRIDNVADRQLSILKDRFGSEFQRSRYQAVSVQPYELDWIQDVSQLMNKRFSNRDSSILLYPFGPKVHSIGLSLLALQRDDIAVIGRTPASYFKRSVEPTGDAQLVSLTDLSSLTSRSGDSIYRSGAKKT